MIGRKAATRRETIAEQRAPLEARNLNTGISSEFLEIGESLSTMEIKPKSAAMGRVKDPAKRRVPVETSNMNTGIPSESVKIGETSSESEMGRVENMNPGPEKASEIGIKRRYGKRRPRDPTKPRVHYSSMLEAFEKDLYLLQEPRKLGPHPSPKCDCTECADSYDSDDSTIVDPANLSDYDDDLVVVPDGVDPDIYKWGRRCAVADDRFLLKDALKFYRSNED